MFLRIIWLYNALLGQKGASIKGERGLSGIDGEKGNAGDVGEF